MLWTGLLPGIGTQGRFNSLELSLPAPFFLGAPRISIRSFFTKEFRMNKLLFLWLTAFFVLTGCSVSERPYRSESKSTPPSAPKAMVTFIELGSVNCIPCRAMQPIMRELEREFGNQIQIKFYDILKDDAPTKTYGIRVMPTQVFLDQEGREFHRHEGFYPLADIEKVLLARGLYK
jgi:thioredoxin 1